MTFIFKTEDKTVDSIETLVRVYQTERFYSRITSTKPPVIWHGIFQRDSHAPYGQPSSVTWLQLLHVRQQTNTGTPHRSDCRNTLMHAHTTSRSLPTCDISLGWLTLPAPDAGTLYVINPAIHPRQLWRYCSLWWEPQMPHSEVTVITLNKLVWLIRCTLVYEKFPVRICTATPSILTENFHALSHSLQENFLIVHRLGNVLSNQIPFHLISVSFYHVCSLSFWEYW